MHTNENNNANTWSPTAENQVHVTAPVERNTCPAASTFHNVCQCVGHTYEPSTQAVGYLGSIIAEVTRHRSVVLFEQQSSRTHSAD